MVNMSGPIIAKKMPKSDASPPLTIIKMPTTVTWGTMRVSDMPLALRLCSRTLQGAIIAG
jgi:hypothetical protein